MRNLLPKLFVIVVLITVTVLFSSKFLMNTADAGSLTNAKLILNNSQAAASGVTYTFNWTTSVTTSIKQIGILICTTASGACSGPSGFSPGSPTLASDNIAGSGRTTSDPNSGGERFRVVVSTPSSQSTQTMQLTFTGVTNPSTINTTYYARITTYSDTGSTAIDTATVAFAVLDTTSIAMSATVDPNFTFSIAGVSSGGNLNGGTGNINITTTATTIPFGTLSVGTGKIGAHDVTVTTNAGGGYVVTASHSGTLDSKPLTSGSNNISPFTGTNASPASWSAPAGGTANTNTGFFGYTTEDATLCTGSANRFTSSGPKWAGSTTTGQEIICSTAGVSSETTRIGWELQVNAIQPAGSYTGTVILVATPTY